MLTPREGETYLEGAVRRLKEELGIEADLSEKFHFIYKADVGVVFGSTESWIMCLWEIMKLISI